MTWPPRDLSRDDYLKWIGMGLTEHAAASHMLPSDLSTARRCEQSPDVDLVGLFCDNAAALSMKPTRCPSTDLSRTIVTTLQQHDVRSVLSTIDDAALREAVEGALCATRDTLTGWPASREAVLHADLVITDVAAAIAETGTIVYDAGPNRSRCGHAIAPVHLALVRPEQIQADLLDFFTSPACADSLQRSASTVLISGPSKTADIEGVLVEGVHGPHTVHVLIIDD